MVRAMIDFGDQPYWPAPHCATAEGWIRQRKLCDNEECTRRQSAWRGLTGVKESRFGKRAAEKARNTSALGGSAVVAESFRRLQESPLAGGRSECSRCWRG